MIYRTLGKTALKVSQLGFGAMRLPMKGQRKDAKVDIDLAVPMLHEAFRAGVNYVDTAVVYCNQDSQRAVGLALKGWRDKIILSTKNHCYGTDEFQWWTNLTDSLKRLDVDCIDIYNIHGLSWKFFTELVFPHTLEWMHKALDQGLIRHVCCSFHDSNEALRRVIDCGEFESITVQYNMLDRSLEDGIAHAREKNVGIVVMGPVGGGRLGATSAVLEKLVPGISRVPELALRFVLANPNISLALSGMSDMEQIRQNVAVAGDNRGLAAEELDAIDIHLRRLREMADLYCTGCKYCLPCPNGVVIPRIFECLNYARVYGMPEMAKKSYQAIGSTDWDKDEKKAGLCKSCGQCEKKCPQKIAIRQQLKAAHDLLGE
ncbi:MAG: aldo/keto reductase [Planctomycetes bacterium]|nr:aldo/keto reductase [Planctomycetota bacterium]